MEYSKISSDTVASDVWKLTQGYKAKVEQQREILMYITEIGASLRLQMDIHTLLKRVTVASCQALRFRYSVLYMAEGTGFFRVRATSGISDEEEVYLQQHPLPETLVAQLTTEDHRVSDSYFIPAESPLWKDESIASYFVIVDEGDEPELTSSPVPLIPDFSSSVYWRPEDLMIVPLVSGDGTLLGFLTPDAPLDGLRPTAGTMALFELFANQAAVAIEGARLYEEARQSNEERAALIEIGRALSTPEALSDLQTVYQTIYEQVRRVMRSDAFFVTRYYQATDCLFMEYLIDEGVVYPAMEYKPIRPQTRQFLLQERVGLRFSSAQEYLNFTKHSFNIDEDIIGSDRPSESLLFVPIRYGEEVIGMLSAQSYTPHAYTQRHLEMLKEIGVQAAIAITNARMYSELREALKQAQVSEQLKNHFLMTASHELRTPLTAVQGYVELLGEFGDTLDEETKQRFITHARRACEELVLLLGNVMDASRIEQDRVTLNLGPVRVLQAVQMVLEILEPMIARERRPVEIRIPDSAQVWADDLRLRQILLNLVGNALKYSPAPNALAIFAECIDQAELYRRISSHNQQEVPNGTADQFVIIAIRDWGPGIALEDQPKLFTKFMRLVPAINSMQRGAGLGLYLCRQLTEAMGGQIWMESNGIPGEGSTFFVALPRYCG